MYKLKDTNGKANFLLRAGKHTVKNSMPVTSAQALIEKGKLTDSPFDDYPIGVDDTYFFEGIQKEGDAPDGGNDPKNTEENARGKSKGKKK